MTQEQAATSSYKNLVTRALGVDDTVSLELNEHEVQPDDLYVICSDGLSDMVDDVEIASIADSDRTMALKADHLVEVANGYGGRDNISVLLVQVEAGGEKMGLIRRLLRK